MSDPAHERSNFTFNDSIHISSTPAEQFPPKNWISAHQLDSHDNFYDYQAKAKGHSSTKHISTQNTDMETVLNFQNLKHITSSQSDLQETSRTNHAEASTAIQTGTTRAPATRRDQNYQNRNKPPTILNMTASKASSSHGPGIMPSSTKSNDQCIRQFLYQTQSNQGESARNAERSIDRNFGQTTERSHSTNAKKPPTHENVPPKAHRFKPTSTLINEDKPNRKQLVNQLRELINLETSLETRQEEEQTLSTFEVIENLIKLRQNHSFARRCQKLKKLKEERSLNDQNHVTFSDTLVAVDSKSWIPQAQNLFGNQRTRSMPKLVLPNMSSDDSTSSCETITSQQRSKSAQPNRAVDSNRAIVTTFYVKGLLVKGLKSFAQYRQEQESKRFLVEATRKQRRLRLIQSVWQAFHTNQKLHDGHARANLIAQRFYFFKKGRASLHKWNHFAQSKHQEDKAYDKASVYLTKRQKLRLFKQWRTVMLEQKMLRMQYKTTKRIVAQRVVSIAFYALRAFARHQIRDRYLQQKCKTGNSRRLEFKAFKSWQKFLLGQRKKASMRELADQLYAINLERVALGNLKEYMEHREHRKQKFECANALRGLQLKRNVLIQLKTNQLRHEHKRHRQHEMRKFYHRKLKQRFIKVLHATNIEFIERSVLAEDFLQRRKKRVIMYLLKAYVKFNRGSFKSITPQQTYYIYVMLQGFAGKVPKLDFAALQYEQRLSQRYVNYQANATSLLKAYYKLQVFKTWKQECARVLSLKQKFRANLLSRIMEHLSLKAFANGKRRKKVKQMNSKKNLKTTLFVFRSLKAFTMRSKALKKTAKKAERLSVKKCKSRYFSLWFDLFANITQENHLERYGDKASKGLVFKKFFGRWRKKYHIVLKKQELDKRLKNFQRRHFKAKFFQKWISRTYKYAELSLTDFSILTAQKRKLMTVVFRAFQKFSSIAHKKRELYAVLGQKRTHNLMGRLVRSWRVQMPELKQKRILVQAVRDDYLRKLKNKVFDALRYRRNYAIERSATDAYMTNAIQGITMRRFFKRWEGLFSRRLGLQLLSDSIEKLQLRTFFRQGHAKAQRDVQIEQHMHLFKEFQLLSGSVHRLHRHARRKDYLQAKILACMQLRDSVLMNTVIQGWRQRVAQSKRNLKMAFYSFIAINKVIKKKYFNVLKKRMADRAKIRSVRRKYLDGLLRQVFFTLRNQIYLSKVKVFISVQYRREQAQAILTQWRSIAASASQENRAKYELMDRVRTGQMLTAWQLAAARQKELRKLQAIGIEKSEMALMKDTFESLREFCQLKRLAQVRQTSILAYVMQKHQVKAFAALLQATQQSRQSRKNKEIAAVFQREATEKKVFFELTVHMTRRKCHRQCITYLTKRRLMPMSFAHLKEYAIKLKIIKSQKATAFAHLSSSLQSKVMTALKNRVVFKKQERDVFKQLEVRYFDKLVNRTFNGWTKVQFLIQERRAKRYCLTKIISDVDTAHRLSTFFKAFQNIAELQKIAAKQRTMQIRTARKRRIFEEWQESNRNKRALEELGVRAEQLHTETMIRNCFEQWHHRTAILTAVNSKAVSQLTKQMAKAFKCLKLAVNLKKAKSYALMWHQEFQQRIVIKALRNKILRRQYCDQCVVSMQEVLGKKLLQKSLLSLRYYVLTTKGARLMQEKIEQKIVTKAFDGLKYQTISNRISTGYVKMKQAELKQKMMKRWVAKLVLVRKQRILLAPVLKRMQLQRLAICHFTWKQEAFRAKFIEKLQEHLLIPVQVESAVTIFNKWRKYSKLKHSAGFLSEHIRINREENTKRRIFQLWLGSAIQQAPMSLFCSKLERLNVIIGARRGFQAILNHCHIAISQENAIDQFIDERNHRQLQLAWAHWRTRFQTVRKGAALTTYHNGQILFNALQTWKEAFNERNQDRTMAEIENQAMQQAFAYYCQQQEKEAFTKMVFFLLRRRQKRQAIQFRNANLSFSGFKGLLVHARQAMSQGSLNAKQREFMKYKQNKLVQSSFATWFEAFKEESLVRNFQAYRAKRAMSAFVGQMVIELNISTKLEKIGRHAEMYFGKRSETKTMAACFRALKINRDSNHLERQRFEILAEKADEFRATSLKEAVFREWKNQVQKPAQVRSTLYTVFSGWKFHTKERVLLKKYLFECGESIGDMSMMTTLEMKDSVRRMVTDNQNASFDQQPRSNSSFADNSHIKASYAKVNQSLEPVSKMQQVDDYTFNLNVNRSLSSLASRHFTRLNQKTSKTTLEAEDSYDMRTTPMIMHKSLDTRFQSSSNQH